MAGPLQGVRIIEIASLAPGPFCAMMLADAGAEVVRIDRLEDSSDDYPVPWHRNLLNRNRKSIALDLKAEAGRATLLQMCARADGLIEGFRPGVMERLGLGPDDCLAANPALVYGRITGWGQEGPLREVAGHDINYLALTGALHAIGSEERPLPPLNLLGDFAGGGAMLAFGMVCALLEARQSGKGQVIDAAMTDGAALMMTLPYTMHNEGVWSAARGSNLVDGGAPHYRTYRTADGKFICVGAIEPKFYRNLLGVLGLAGDPLFRNPNRRSAWPEMSRRMAEIFAGRSRAEWEAAFSGVDACFAPVLSMAEAPLAAHNVARGTFLAEDGLVQPAPAPRFSRTPGAISRPPVAAGAHTRAALAEWGVGAADIERLLESGVAVQQGDG